MTHLYVSDKPTFFKDSNKRLNDLLNKEFPLENKVEWKGETENGVIVESNLVQKNGVVVGTFTPKYKYKEYGADFSLELNTKKELKAELSFADQLTKGLKLILTGNSKGGEFWGSLGHEFKSDNATFTGSVDYGKEAGSTIKSSFTLGKNGFAVGASGEYFLGSDSNELKEVNSIATYGCDEFSVAAFARMKNGTDEKNEIGVTYHHMVNRDLAVGTEVAFDNASADAKPKLTFAAEYKLQDDTILKGKFDTNGQLGLSFSQKFNRYSKFVLSTSVDTNNAFGKGGASKLGFTLALNS